MNYRVKQDLDRKNSQDRSQSFHAGRVVCIHARRLHLLDVA
jgi:hypothetical protein